MEDFMAKTRQTFYTTHWKKKTREIKRQNWLKRKGNEQGMEYCEGKKKKVNKLKKKWEEDKDRGAY